MYKKNEATATSRIVYFHLINKSDGSAVTSGTVTVNVIKNGVSALASASPTHVTGGVWSITLTQSELNSDSVAVVATHANAIPSSTFIKTTAKLISELKDFDHDLEFVTFASPVDANITEVTGTAVTDITDFHGSTSGLSTFDPNVTFVTVGWIRSVAVFSPDDFKAATAAFDVDQILDVNIISVAGQGVTDITDFHVNTSGLSTFDHTTDKVDLVDNAVDSLTFATSAIDKLISRVFATNVDGSVSYEKVLEMLLAFMAGRVTVTDSGDYRYFQFYKQNGSSVMFGITAAELLGQEGQRSTTGYIP